MLMSTSTLSPALAVAGTLLTSIGGILRPVTDLLMGVPGVHDAGMVMVKLLLWALYRGPLLS